MSVGIIRQIIDSNIIKEIFLITSFISKYIYFINKMY